MARNVEIKARIDRLDELRRLVSAIADQGPFELIQDDTFFACAGGRLKLRTETGADTSNGTGAGVSSHGGELIFYRRADHKGPKESFYVRSRTADPDGLRSALTLAYGQAGRVRKHRTLFLVGRTRLHLDDVQGLGCFLELEVVLEDSEPTESGMAVADELLGRLGIDAAQLVECAYVDLSSRPD